MGELGKRRDETAAPPRSRDPWDQVFDQLGRRPLFKVAITILALLYAGAVYAPLIANDRPYVLEAIDYRAYRQAASTLTPVTISIERLLAQGPDGYLEARTAGSEASWEESLASEGSAAETRLETLALYLGDGAPPSLAELGGWIERAVDEGLAGRLDAARVAATEARGLVGDVRAEVRPFDPAAPSAGGRKLIPATTYPLGAAIGAGEVFFMVLWAFVLAWPLANRFTNRILLGGDRDRIRAARRRKLGVVLGVSALAACAVALLGPDSSRFDSAPYKTGLTNGDIVAVRAVFPPLAFGFAETSSGESFRPPTWDEAAEISEVGYYVRGPRVPRTDPHTGFRPPPMPVEVRHGEPDANSSWRHPLGTDALGRDVLVRLVWGGRVSLSVGLISAVLLVLIGTLIGAVAGYCGGRIDFLLSRLIEVVLCFPAFFLILMVVAFTDPDVVPPIIAIVVVIALVRWTGVARLARAEFLRLREMEFTYAAQALGVSARRTIFRHLLPNAIGPILVAGTFSVAAGILTESALSFLGFGVQHPIPSWGSLVNESKSVEHWWIQVFPGLLIFVTVVCYNLIGDAIRDAVDPKMKVNP